MASQTADVEPSECYNVANLSRYGPSSDHVQAVCLRACPIELPGKYTDLVYGKSYASRLSNGRTADVEYHFEKTCTLAPCSPRVVKGLLSGASAEPM